VAPAPKKKKPAAAKPAAPPTPEPMSTAGSWFYTIGFSLAVVAFIIGVYQTLVEQDLAGNYWLFMISIGLLFGIRYQRIRSQRPKPGA
jgi:hypothetical protein